MNDVCSDSVEICRLNFHSVIVHHPTEVMSESRPETSDITSHSLSCRRIRFGEVYTHQLPVPDRLVFSRVSRTLSQNQENRSGKIRLDLFLPLP